jgi:DNA-binding HxlR family transcriptional regulator
VNYQTKRTMGLLHMTSQENWTTLPHSEVNAAECPGESILKLLSGKWKPQILRLAITGPLRFNSLLRLLPDASKQSLAIALRELEEADLLVKTTIREKPLHIEYTLTERARSMISIFQLASSFVLPGKPTHDPAD